jgi:hypothetical protein
MKTPDPRDVKSRRAPTLAKRSSMVRAEPSLEGVPNNVRVVRAEAVDQASFNELTPLLVRGAMTRAIARWTDDWLLENFGDIECQVSLDSRPANSTFREYEPLRDYLEGLRETKTPRREVEYIFQPRMEHAFEPGKARPAEDLDVPRPIWRLGEDTSWWLTLGPTLSGTLPHFHRAAINVLARGRKRWAIYVGSNPIHTQKLLQEGFSEYGAGSQVQDWFVRECPQLRSRRRVQLWECVQEPGDLLYVPPYFIHAVVNLEPVLGFSIQFFSRRDFRRLAAHREGFSQALRSPDPKTVAPGFPRRW